jgi:hypothetical protein
MWCGSITRFCVSFRELVCSYIVFFLFVSGVRVCCSNLGWFLVLRGAGVYEHNWNVLLECKVRAVNFQSECFGE